MSDLTVTAIEIPKDDGMVVEAPTVVEVQEVCIL